MDLNNKREHYSKLDRDTASKKIYVLLDEVESNEEDHTDNILNNLDNNFVTIKNLENNIVLDEQPNNLLIPEANIYLNEETECEVNDEENELEQERTKKRRGKENKAKEK